MGEFKMPGFDMTALMEMQRKNIETITTINQTIFGNLQSFVQRQAELMRQGFEETSNLMNAMMSSPTTQDKVIRQAEASKNVVEKCMANARDASETLDKCNSHTMETISNRMNEGMGELRSLIKTDIAA
jgi:phasin family protein